MRRIDTGSGQGALQLTVMLFLINLFVAAVVMAADESWEIGRVLSHGLVIGIFATSLFVWNAFSRLGFSDPVNYLLAVIIVFHSSQSILMIFGLEGYGLFRAYPLTAHDVAKANVVVMLGYLFLLAGATIGRLAGDRKVAREEGRDRSWTAATPGVARLLLVTGVAALVVDFDPSWLHSRYMEFGETTAARMIWTHCLPVAGFIDMSLPREDGHWKRGAAILVALTAIYLLMGNRGYAVSVLISGFWLYNHNIGRVSLAAGAGFVAIVFVLVAVFYQLKPATVEEKLSLSVLDMEGLQPAVDVFVEGSKSYRTVIYTVKDVPSDKPFDMGRSYAWALTTIVPNFLGGLHPAQTRDSPSEWFKWRFNPAMARLGYGYGFSVVAEAYYNFGTLGVIAVMALLGYLFSRLTVTARASESNMPTLIMAILLQNMVWGVRNVMESIARPIVWEILFVLVAFGVLELMRAGVRPRVSSGDHREW